MKEHNIKIKMFLAGDRDGPSCYYRGYELARILSGKDVNVEIRPSHIPTYPRRKSKFAKLYLYTLNFLKRLSEIFRIKKDEIIFIQTAIAFWGSPVLEWIIKNILGNKIILDIDDAYFIYKPPGLQKILGPWRSRILVKLSDAVIVGSHYLEEYARKYNPNVYLVPTSVDAEKHMPLSKANKPVIIGWIGNPTGLRYLNILKESLEALTKRCDFEFRIIGANEYETDVPAFKGVKVKLIQWSRETEWQEISKFDIGVMPLYDTEWEKGKCAFKAIQYMVLGIPAVGSPIGENRYLIKDGINGFLAGNADEWINKLELLIKDESLRWIVGAKGRETVLKNYSLHANAKRVLKAITY
ncbi:MAG: glycosyltransferase [Planctomycetes bacterium]|nr:glycosyltransferase [Planctomycetota bacterium]